MGVYKRLTIVGAILTVLGGALIIQTRLPKQVFAGLPLEGLATPRVHVTALPQANPPASDALLAAAPEAAQVNAQPADAQPAPAQLEESVIQFIGPPAGQPIDPANEYIYRFANSFRPLQDGGGCAAIWEIIPDYARLPNYLTTPDRPEQIYSKVSYYFLAAMLIRNEAVDASECQNNGISLDNMWVANNCGLAKAYTAVITWQNRFNEVILNISRETGVPAQLMKNIFSRESQFWPGIFTTMEEAGFGQLTVAGADVLLMWNNNFYSQFCPQVLIAEACSRGYNNLTVQEQQMLTGALVRMVNATCPTCPEGVDPYLAEFSVRIFAENMLANCNQVAQVILNESSRPPNRTSSYEDLWLLTLVNYHAGSGCLTEAVRNALEKGFDLDWALVSANLPAYCTSAKGYVEEVIFMPEIAPNPTAPPVAPTATATPLP